MRRKVERMRFTVDDMSQIQFDLCSALSFYRDTYCARFCRNGGITYITKLHDVSTLFIILDKSLKTGWIKTSGPCVSKNRFRGCNVIWSVLLSEKLFITKYTPIIPNNAVSIVTNILDYTSLFKALPTDLFSRF